MEVNKQKELKNKEDINVFKDNLKMCMIKKGLTKIDLINKGFNPFTIRDYLNGARHPSRQRLAELAKVLDVRISDLIEPQINSISISDAFNDDYVKTVRNTKSQNKKLGELLELLPYLSDSNISILLNTAKALPKENDK